MELNINCDVGVNLPSEEKLMPYLNSCSIASGGHYGNFETVDNTMKSAIKHGLKIGAQVSFPDLQGFGNRALSFPFELLVRSLTEQLKLFLLVADYNNVTIDHVKPHGALYNLAIRNEFHADAIFEAMNNVGMTCSVYGNGDFFIERAFAQKAIVVHKEVYADVLYQADGFSMTSTEDISCITDPEVVWNHILGVSQKNTIQTTMGKSISVKADTFCIHRENPQAYNILRDIRSRTI